MFGLPAKIVNRYIFIIALIRICFKFAKEVPTIVIRQVRHDRSRSHFADALPVTKFLTLENTIDKVPNMAKM